MGNREAIRPRLVADLTDAIAGGVHRPGDKLPSETELAARYGVHRLTARAALEELAASGLVTSEPRQGWYVLGRDRLRYPLMSIDRGRVGARKDVWLTFLDNNDRTGDVILTDVVVGPPPAEVARRLRLDGGQHCVMRRRTRRVDGVPWMRSTGFFPLWLVEGTSITEPVDQQDPSPLAVLIAMGHGPAHDTDSITARMPTPEERELFTMPRGVPVIVNLRTSVDRDGTPVRCTLDIHPAHRFELIAEQDYTKEDPAPCPQCKRPTGA